MGQSLNLKAEVDNRNRFFFFFFFFQFFYFGQSQTTKTSIRKMLLAALTIGAILGSSSVAQAGRKCIACVARRNGTTVNADCNQSDVSEFIPNAPNAHTQFDAGKIMIQECSDDEKCLYYTFSKLDGTQQTWRRRLCRNEEKFRKRMEKFAKKFK